MRVAQVEAPADVVGDVGYRAVHGLVLGQQHPADAHRAKDVLAVGELLVDDALEVAGRSHPALVADQRRPVAAGDDLHAAVLARGVDQRNPEVDHEGLRGVGLQVAQILVPWHDPLVLERPLGADVELRMGQDLRPDHGLDDVEKRRTAVDPEHARRALLAAAQVQQGGRVVELQRQRVQPALERFLCVRVGQPAVGQRGAREGVDVPVELGAERLEHRRVDGVVDEEVALLSEKGELLLGESGHGFLRSVYSSLPRFGRATPSERSEPHSKSEPFALERRPVR